MRGLGVALAFALATPAAAAPLDDHTIELPAVAAATVGATVVLPLTLRPRAGFRVAPGPIEVTLAPVGTGLTAYRRVLRAGDAADPQAVAPRFDLAVRAAAAGEHSLAVETRAWVCGRYTCRPIHDRRTVVVRVTAAR